MAAITDKQLADYIAEYTKQFQEPFVPVNSVYKYMILIFDINGLAIEMTDEMKERIDTLIRTHPTCARIRSKVVFPQQLTPTTPSPPSSSAFNIQEPLPPPPKRADHDIELEKIIDHLSVFSATYQSCTFDPFLVLRLEAVTLALKQTHIPPTTQQPLCNVSWERVSVITEPHKHPFF
jgi:hypothetical protein